MSIGSRLWPRFWLITRPLVQSEVRGRAAWLLALLLLLLLAVSTLNVINSYVGRDFMTAISLRDADGFHLQGWLYVGIFSLSTVVAVFYRFTEERLGLLWRGWLTNHLAERFLTGDARARVEAIGDIDNPDQRIAEDVRTFTAMTLSLLLILCNSSITLFAFCGVLWSITPWLFAAAVGYAAFGSLGTLFLGRPLVPLNIAQLKKEADLRYELIRVREGNDERSEAALLGNRLDAVIDNMRRIILLNRNLGFFTTGYNYLIQLIPVVIVAPLYIRGQVEFGQVTQAAMAFAHVMGAFSLIVLEFGRISSFAAVITRVGALCEALDGAAAPAEEPARAEAPTP
ncbi:MAG: SbmA/BacA-like family transporter [Gemmataceae bacterium]